MKNIIMLALVGLSSLAFAKVETLSVDPTTAKVTWVARKLGSSHNGTVVLKSGEVNMDQDKLTGGKLVIDMTTITILDIPAKDEDNGKLKTHLESKDFFAVKENKEAMLVLKKVDHTTPLKATVSGDLTIKGKTHPVTFMVDLIKTTEAVTAKGLIVVDRTKYDIKYNSADFFNLPVDRIIKNEFDISFEVTAKKKTDVVPDVKKNSTKK